MKLSIIIPVYRTEGTLDRCVRSVLGQENLDIEIILVDDGSSDNCPQLCDQWAEADMRIQVIHKENGGLSDARNAGIDMATGDYITFVDSDDFIEPNTYWPLMVRLEHAPDIDIVEYPIFVHYGAPHLQRLDMTPEATYHDMEAYWLDGQAYKHTYACNKIFRKSLFDTVRFPLGRVFEDAYTLPLLLNQAKTVQTVNQGLYYYCSNDKGITRTADGKALRMLLDPHLEIISKTNRRDQAFQTYYLNVLNIQMDVYELTGQSPILPRLSLNPAYFKGAQKVKALLLNTLGIKILCKLNTIIHTLWRIH